MSKINIKISLKENEKQIIQKETIAIIQENIIKYKDDNINIVNIKKQTLKRKTLEYEITLDFQNQKGIYKYLNMDIPIAIKILEKNINEQEFYVKYKQTILEQETIYTYKLEVEK